MSNVRRQNMPTNFVPVDALSQVVFVHDYIQLVFQDQAFSFYNKISVVNQSDTVRQGAPGFADFLVSLIGTRVKEASALPPSALELTFQCGAKLRVLRGEPYENGPEAFQFNGPDGLVVEQN